MINCWRRLALLIAATLLLIGCSKDSSSSDSLRYDPADSSSLSNRVEAIMCSGEERTPTWPEPQYATPDDSCMRHADCVDGPNGRCIDHPDGGTECLYDECLWDADCRGNAVCVCGERDEYGDSWPVNTCTYPGDCRTADDCESGLCLAGWYYCQHDVTGVWTFNCASAKDDCTAGSQCKPKDGLERHCLYEDQGREPGFYCMVGSVTCGE